MKTRPYLKTAIYFIPIVICVVLIQLFSPPMEKARDGYSSTILAFEFSDTKEKLDATLNPLTEKEISNLDKLNYVDFGLILFYSLLLWQFLQRTSQLQEVNWILPISVIIITTLVFDVAENTQLLKLTKLYGESSSNEVYNNPLFLLAVFTWTKWLLLATCFACFGFILLKRNLFSKIIGLFLILPLLLAIYAFTGKATAQDMFATSVFASFFILFIYCLFYRLEVGSQTSLNTN